MWEGENRQNYPNTCNFMILVIWVVWFLNQYLNLIILLNFLIAIISQSYEEIMTEQSVFRYQHRAELNSEARQMFRKIGKGKDWNRQVDCMLISCSIDRE